MRDIETKTVVEEADIRNMELQLQRKMFDQVRTIRNTSFIGFLSQNDVTSIFCINGRIYTLYSQIYSQFNFNLSCNASESRNNLIHSIIFLTGLLPSVYLVLLTILDESEKVLCHIGIFSCLVIVIYTGTAQRVC